MSAANEITKVNTFYGANLVTLTATGTFTVINGGEIILDLNSSLGTVLLTLHTADTAV